MCERNQPDNVDDAVDPRVQVKILYLSPFSFQ